MLIGHGGGQWSTAQEQCTRTAKGGLSTNPLQMDKYNFFKINTFNEHTHIYQDNSSKGNNRNNKSINKSYRGLTNGLKYRQRVTKITIKTLLFKYTGTQLGPELIPVEPGMEAPPPSTYTSAQNGAITRHQAGVCQAIHKQRFTQRLKNVPSLLFQRCHLPRAVLTLTSCVCFAELPSFPDRSLPQSTHALRQPLPIAPSPSSHSVSSTSGA